jgi:hypothetical protein
MLPYTSLILNRVFHICYKHISSLLRQLPPLQSRQLPPLQFRQLPPPANRWLPLSSSIQYPLISPINYSTSILPELFRVFFATAYTNATPKSALTNNLQHFFLSGKLITPQFYPYRQTRFHNPRSGRKLSIKIGLKTRISPMGFLSNLVYFT